jgi:hypothetical protein
MKEIKYEVDGMICKIGVHNKVFNWINGEWVKSTKNVSELRKARRIA